MRKVINIDKDWKFSKEASSVPSTFPSDWESIDLPYTFNGDDGQDGARSARMPSWMPWASSSFLMWAYRAS